MHAYMPSVLLYVPAGQGILGGNIGLSPVLYSVYALYPSHAAGHQSLDGHPGQK